MTQKPTVIREHGVSDTRAAMLPAALVAIGVILILFGILAAIRLTETWFVTQETKTLDIALTPVPQTELQQEQEIDAVTDYEVIRITDAAEQDFEPTVLPAAIPILPEVPTEYFTHNMPVDSPFELVPEESLTLRITTRPVPSKTSSSVTHSANNVTKDNNVPDVPVKYKKTPALPGSINVNKVGRVDALIKVLISVNTVGIPVHTELVQSTQNPLLDQIFMDWVKENWSFYPAQKAGKPVAAKVLIPVRLKID